MSGFDYEVNISHISSELGRINKLIALNSMHIVADKKDKIFSKKNKIQYGIPIWAARKAEYKDELKQIQLIKEKINRNAQVYLSLGKELRLISLKKIFGLSSMDIDILLICLIGEFDSHYQDIWMELHSSVKDQYPSVELVISLLSKNLEEKLKIGRRLHKRSALFRYCLLKDPNDSDHDATDIDFTTGIKVDTRVINYLIGIDEIPDSLSTVLTCSIPVQKFENLFLSQDISLQVECLNQVLTNKSSYYIILRGKEGAGHIKIAEAICNKLEMKLIIVDVVDMLSYPLKELGKLFPLIQREALLQRACIYWNGIDLLTSPEKKHSLSLFIKQLKKFQCISFFPMNMSDYFPYYRLETKLVEIDIPAMNTEDRYNLWQNVLPKASLKILTDISRSFRLERGHICEIASYIISLSSSKANACSEAEVYKACRKYANKYVSSHVTISNPSQNLDDIVLSENNRQGIEDIIDWVRYRHVVYEQGGFSQNLSIADGLIALFFGAPGTGKTMAAGVIANSLNLSLYKVNLSSVLSKFVGETEKHLDKVFDEAENSNAVLFFDEADALFGKRGEVQDARDNYANIQTSYLLQKVEEYSGVVILSTNLKNNMDTAFTRRLHFSLEFKIPTSEERKKIWQNIWPERVRLEPKIQIEKLASVLEISGGYIKNIALSAAFKAVSGLPVNQNEYTMITVTAEHLLLAIRKELKKMGKIITKNQLEGVL